MVLNLGECFRVSSSITFVTAVLVAGLSLTSCQGSVDSPINLSNDSKDAGVSIADKLFASSDSPGSRALCAAEHSDCPSTGPLPSREWIHLDVGDDRIALGWCTMSPWRGHGKLLADKFKAENKDLLEDWRSLEKSHNKGGLRQVRNRIPINWIRMADEHCTKQAHQSAKRFEREMNKAGIPVGPVFLIRAVDLWNQRPIAASFFVTPALKKELEGLSYSADKNTYDSDKLEQALREATIESFRKNGVGEYVTGGRTWGGLFAICRNYPAYQYLLNKYGPINSVQWKRGCIAHNQNGRTDRIKNQLIKLQAWSFDPKSIK